MAQIKAIAPTTERRIKSLTETVTQMQTSLGGVVGKLRNMHSRLCGGQSEPEKGESENGPESVRNEIDELQYQIQLLDDVIGECHNVASELNEI